MATSLYDLSVATYLQGLGAAERFLAKGLKHLTDAGIDPNEVVEARLFPDMNPFRFQAICIAHHSLGAIEAVKSGVFRPPGRTPDHDYAALQQIVSDAKTALEKLTPDEVNAHEGGDVVFHLGEMRMPFKAEGFVLSFSLPNFYFHATTAYDILRMKGVPLGKRDFMGALRMAG